MVAGDGGGKPIGGGGGSEGHALGGGEDAGVASSATVTTAAAAADTTSTPIGSIRELVCPLKPPTGGSAWPGPTVSEVTLAVATTVETRPRPRPNLVFETQLPPLDEVCGRVGLMRCSFFPSLRLWWRQRVITRSQA